MSYLFFIKRIKFLINYLFENIQEILTYIVIGFSILFFKILLIKLLLNFFHYIVVISIAYIFGAVCHFLLNKILTFKNTKKNYIKMTTSYLILLFSNYIFSLCFAVMFVEFFNLSIIFSVIGTYLFIPLFNFLFLKYYVFKQC